MRWRFRKYNFKIVALIVGVVIVSILSVWGIKEYVGHQIGSSQQKPTAQTMVIEGLTPEDIEDIDSATYCGDGICIPEVEDCQSCPSDCGAC